jgi:site-specific recombinase XerD
MSDDAVQTALVPLGKGIVIPALLADAGEETARQTVDFFTVKIRNKNTRRAYASAIARFCTWCEQRGIALAQLQPVIVAAYVEQHGGSAPTVKQHLAAIRMLCDYLVVHGVLRMNPAAAVRGPKYSAKRGKTPVLSGAEARGFLEAIGTKTILDLRDRALVAVMVYTFGRVGAVAHMRIEDYYAQGKRWWFRLHEKGGKRHEVPAHHLAEMYVDAYLDKAGLRDDRKGWLFRAVNRKRQLTVRRLHEVDVFRMIKRRASAGGVPDSTCCHTFRATGITAYLQNGGTLEKAQQIACHESPRTTKLYDRSNDTLTLDEIERILL